MEQTDTKKIDSTQSEAQRNQMWSMVLSLLNSSAFFSALTKSAEHYLENDRLPLSYFFLMGLIGAALGWGLDRLIKKKSLKFKKIVTVALTVISLGFPLLIR